MQRNEHTGGSHERPVSSAASNGKAEIRIEVVKSGKPALVAVKKNKPAIPGNK